MPATNPRTRHLPLLSLLLAVPLPALAAPPPVGTARVAAVPDLVTLAVDTGAGRLRIRLPGIEPCHPEAPPKVCAAAGAWLTVATLGQLVRLEEDPVVAGFDRQRRLLRHVRLGGGRLLAEELVARGFALARRGTGSPLEPRLVAAERAARAAQRGVWSYDAWQRARRESVVLELPPARPEPLPPRTTLGEHASRLGTAPFADRLAAFRSALAELAEEP